MTPMNLLQRGAAINAASVLILVAACAERRDFAHSENSASNAADQAAPDEPAQPSGKGNDAGSTEGSPGTVALDGKGEGVRPIGSEACEPTERDCTSELDNDCDGFPDDTVDDTCICVPGNTEPCDAHPAFDGRGPCRAGSRICLSGDSAGTSSWSGCEGSIGPSSADSCEIIEDDSNCDGTPNSGCACVEGETLPCGPIADVGICRQGISECVGATFSACAGAIFPQPRDCTSDLDNDCDGLPDNAIDSICTCTPGATETCGEHPGLDENGVCRAGQRTCTLGVGNTTARFGACEGSVGPSASEICGNDVDDDCDGENNEPDECDRCTDTCFCDGSECAEMVAIDSLSSTVCALSAAGKVWCWGANQSGQAGVPGFLDQPRPAPVEGLENVTMIAVGGSTTCALRQDTSVACWGSNSAGQLGDNAVVGASFSPVEVVDSSGSTLTGVAKVVAGAQFACALRANDGAVFCWGGFVGNGTNVGSPVAEQVLRFGNVPLVQVGDIAGGTNVVLARSGASWLSWGRGAALGQGGANVSLVATQLMSQPSPSFAAVSVGSDTACATTAASEAYCWGNDIVIAGLGSGEAEVPTRFTALDGTAAFEISSRIGFAVDANGGVRAFGDAGDDLAAGLRSEAATEPLEPTTLPGIAAVKHIAEGINFACALQVDDTVACWGINNRGQIGIGSTTRADTPVLVLPLRR